MKEFILDFLTFFAKTLLIMCFVLASFLFLINVYHYKDVSYTYNFNINDNYKYKEYKKLLNSADKKFKKIDVNDSKFERTAKPIYDYYKSCSKALDDSIFTSFSNKTGIQAIDVYHANNEILQEINSKCMFSIAYNIRNMEKNNQVNHSFEKTNKIVTDKRDIVVDNSQYLVKSGLGNSSYSYTTDITKATIYNKVANEMTLTIDNYYLIASILNDIGNWYVLEYGGNN